MSLFSAFTFKIVIIFHLFPSVNGNASANLLANRRKFLYAIDVQHYIKLVLNDVFTVKQHSIKCGLRDVLQSAIHIK